MLESWTKPNGRLDEINRLWKLVESGRTLHNYIKEAKENREEYTISLLSDMIIFNDVLVWLFNLAEGKKRKAIGLVALRKKNLPMYSYTEDTPGAILSRFDLSTVHDTDRVLKFKLNGMRYAAFVGKDEKGVNSVQGAVGRHAPTPDKLTIRCFNKKAQDYMLEQIQRIYNEMAQVPKQAYISLWQFGDWNRLGKIPPRSIDSVVLADGQKERILEDIEQFLQDEERYVMLGMPYHRGYMFYGPPGTGKSSLAKALALHFQLNLYYLPLGSIHNDTEVIEAIGSLNNGGILLLEDIDVFSSVRNRGEAEGSEEKLSLSAMLNALDGVTTPHGLIVIMTTNDRTHLDPAILREGRIDMHEELKYLTISQAQNLFEHFYGFRPVDDFTPRGMSPAKLLEMFKQNMYDGEAAQKAVIHAINEGTME